MLGNDAKSSTDAETKTSAVHSEDITAMLPLEVIDKAIGTKIRILLSNSKEFQGTLIGFDDFVNVVLQDVTEIGNEASEGKVIRKMLLNGTQIAMLCPAV
ncbi:hypothetical protein JCM33374_g6386 [Metschnikowia sp. JCM 33374]|nr:hypothetical protein JCM33374_g6386 [Metschnikowia sp. JCM 33374]